METSEKKSSKEQLARLSAAALKNKTGRGWKEWIQWLDDLGADKKTPREVQAALAEHVDNVWYRQKIALGYREARGLRGVGELESGYEIGVTRTFPIHSSKAWEVLTSEEGLAAWVGDLENGAIGPDESFTTKEGITGTITVLQPGSHFRIAWQPLHWRQSSILQVRVIGSKSKNAGKSVISFHHEKLPGAGDRSAMKQRWEEKLSHLAEIIKGK
ncbi:MAG: hypothetical protein ACO1N1_20000 [Dyadobacter fermentans]